MIIDTRRPASVAAAGGWTAQPSGTLPSVTADDSDSTYAQSVTNTILRLRVGSHTPSAGHQRHMVRARMRARSVAASGSIAFYPQGPGGGNPISNTAGLSTAVAEYIGSWSADAAFGLGTAGAMVFDVAAQNPGAAANNVRIMEFYIDIDTRAKPDFTPQILDGAGVNQAGATVSDTNVVRSRMIDEVYDGLTPRSWRVAIYTVAQTLEVGFVPFVSTPTSFAGDVGVPHTANHVLSNGSYVAYFELTSNIRLGEAYPSDIEQVAFTVSASVPFGPINVTLTPTIDPPALELCWEPYDPPGDPAPWETPEEVYAQIERTDCNGTQIIALIPDGLTGCYVDRFMSLSRQGLFCGDEGHECEVCYRVRYWGIVDAIQDAEFAVWDTALWDNGLWGIIE